MKTQNKRDQIIQAIEPLLSTRRFHEITLDEVAQAAKIGKGTIYRYFKDKDDLFFHIATAGFDQLCELLEENIPKDSHFQEKLMVVCTQISDFFKDRRSVIRVIQEHEGRMRCFHGEMKQQWVEKRKKLVATVAGILEQGVSEGVIKQELPTETLAALLLGMMRARARELSEDRSNNIKLSEIVDVFLFGVGNHELLPKTVGGKK
ncbi:MAG: TetR/AcrR family transcriptional regulator [Planctomycetes bacterium]|nr:TetR/AcrR family transcriptional regulator [Planctomycetota bacterium]